MSKGQQNFRILFMIILIVALCMCGIIMGSHKAQAEINKLASPFVPWLHAQGLTIQKTADKQTTEPSITTRHRHTKDVHPYAAEHPLLTAQDLLLWLEMMPRDTEIVSTKLETSYSERAGEMLTLFGYGLLNADAATTKSQLHSHGRDTESASSSEPSDQNKKTRAQTVRRFGLPAGAAQSSFILGIGDQVEIVFSGQRKDRDIYTVNGQGLLIVKDLPPVPAAGLKIEDVRNSLNAYAERFHNTKVYVSLYDIHQINVFVTGHVKKPGQITFTVFHNVLDALIAAGGIQKTGSLRKISVIRDGKTTKLDLYDLMIKQNMTADLKLRDGDKIIVPPLGETVAIAGDVKRPGIYELKGKDKNLSQKELLRWGAGTVKPGPNRYMKFELTADGQEVVSETSKLQDASFGNGTILIVRSGQEKRTGFVKLSGHTRKPGLHALVTNKNSLAALLGKDGTFGSDIYPLFAAIKRKDQAHMAVSYIAFPPLQVIKGHFDLRLQDGDDVILFSNKDILSVLNNLANTPIDADHNLISTSPTKQTISIAKRLSSQEPSEEEAREALLEDDVLTRFIHEHIIYLRGAIRKPGAYPITSQTKMSDIFAVAGGIARNANLHNIELTSALSGEGHQAAGRSGTRRTRINLIQEKAEDILLEPGDSVRVNQAKPNIKDHSILIMGALTHPGRYDLLPGDRLSDILRRAGGLTKHAYPDGAIFSRKSERKAEQERFRNVAYDLERSVALALKDRENALDMNQINMARQLASELRSVEAVGRITVEADPAALSLEPELDILMQAGDRLYIPERPLTVRVSGEVLSPAQLQFRREKSPTDYINEAGSYTHNADKDRVFAILPDGSAQPLKVNYWNHKAVLLPPGSTIVVPRDPKPFSFIDSARDISQILSNLAVTGIFLDDISDD